MKHFLWRLLGRKQTDAKYDYEKLKNTVHMLKWLDNDPVDRIWKIMDAYTRSMVIDSSLCSLSIVTDPDWVTGGKPMIGSPDKIIMVRTGVCFQFLAGVKSKSRGNESVNGCLTWAADHLDSPEGSVQRTWIDIGGSMKEYGQNGLLPQRVYEVQV